MQTSQTVFGWFEDSLNRSGVLSLCVWKPEFVGEKDGKVHGGQQREVAYSSWLRFFTPLSHSVNGGEL